MHKTSNILVIFFVLFSVTLFAQSRVFVTSGLKALESRANLFISIEPFFEFWQLSASFNLNLILNPSEKLFSLNVLEKNLGEIFESAGFKLWDLNYNFSTPRMKMFESSLASLEANLTGKVSTYSINHSDFFRIDLKDLRDFFLFSSNIKYPAFSLNIRGALNKDTDELDFEIAPQIPVFFLEVTPSLRFSDNSFQGGGGFVSFSNNGFKGFIGFSFFPASEVTNDLEFSSVKSKSLLNFGFGGSSNGLYISITEKSVSVCSFINFENENLKMYIEPSLIASRGEKDAQVNFSLFSNLEFSITEEWKLNMSFGISPDNSMMSLGILYKIYEEKEGGDKNAASE